MLKKIQKVQERLRESDSTVKRKIIVLFSKREV